MTSVRDILVISLVLFAIGVSLVPLLLAGHRVNAAILNNTDVNNSLEASEVLTSTTEAIDKMDYVYLFGFVAFFVSILILGWFMSYHPVLSVIFFLLLILFVFISIAFQEAWISLTASPALVSTVASLPFTDFILSRLAYFMAVFGLFGLVVMFAKPYVSEGSV